MKRTLFLFVLAASVAAFGQHPSGGMGHAGSMGMNHGHGAMSNHGNGQNSVHTQQPLRDSQIKGGAFHMLERRTGLSSAQLQSLYQQSGAKNFGQFVAACVVSKNMGFTTEQMTQVLMDLKTMKLPNAIEAVGGVNKTRANAEIKKAKSQIKDAYKES